MQKISLPSKNTLEDFLFNKLWSKKKIARYYHISLSTLHRWMKEYDLVNKTPIEIQKKKRSITLGKTTRGKTYPKGFFITKGELKDLLFNKIWSKKKIANHYNVSSGTINRWMKKYDLVGKTPIELQKKKRLITISTKHNFNSLLKRAIKGEVIRVPGFNSDFTEEYLEEKYEK